MELGGRLPRAEVKNVLFGLFQLYFVRYDISTIRLLWTQTGKERKMKEQNRDSQICSFELQQQRQERILERMNYYKWSLLDTSSLRKSFLWTMVRNCVLGSKHQTFFSTENNEKRRIKVHWPLEANVQCCDVLNETKRNRTRRLCAMTRLNYLLRFESGSLT